MEYRFELRVLVVPGDDAVYQTLVHAAQGLSINLTRWEEGPADASDTLPPIAITIVDASTKQDSWPGSILVLQQTDHSDNERILPLDQPALLRARLTSAAHRAHLEAERRSWDAQKRRMEQERLALIGSLSREIRTPIHGLSGMAQLLQGTSLTSEQREYAEIIQESSNTLISSVQDVLNIVKLDKGKLKLKETTFDLVGCFESVIDLLTAGAGNQEVRPAFLPDPALPEQVMGDPTRLRQILINLLSLAMQMSTTHQVVLACDQISNDAHGVSLDIAVLTAYKPNETRQPFVPLENLDEDSLGPELSGEGRLGFLLSHRLVQMMGGCLGLEQGLARHGFRIQLTCKRDRPNHQQRPPRFEGVSVLLYETNPLYRDAIERYLQRFGCRLDICGDPDDLATLLHAEDLDHQVVIAHVDGDAGPGLRTSLRTLVAADRIGAVFTTRVPRGLGREHGRDGMTRLYVPIRGNLLAKALDAALHRGDIPQRMPDSSPPAVEADAPLVLVAEDNLVNRKVAVRMLQRGGYRCEVAVNGCDALHLFQKKHYDLVMMDIKMPEMDGFEATRRIRRMEAGGNRRVPIIAVTASALDGDREACLAAGMDAYISKPIQARELFSQLENLIQPK